MWNLNERRRRGSYVAKVRKKEMERVKKKTNLINNQVNPSNEWICILQQCELNSISWMWVQTKETKNIVRPKLIINAPYELTALV